MTYVALLFARKSYAMETVDLTQVTSLLRQTKADALSKTDKEVIALRDDCSVSLALKTLAAHKFLAAPVVAHTGETEDTDIICFLDIRDIILNFLPCVEEAFIPANSNSMLHRMRILEEKGNPYGSQMIKDLNYLGGDGGFWYGKHAEKASMMELICKGFLSPELCLTKTIREDGSIPKLDHIHRVALFGSDGSTLTNIITQSDIIRFLYEHIGECGSLAEATVQDLGWVGKAVATVQPDTPALDAMKVMAENNISALGVEKNGKLIGNFSMSDMRAITADHFCSLALPVGEFLALEHGTEYSGYAAVAPPGEQMPDSNPSGFARDQERKAAPGSDVGQHLMLCDPSWTFKKVLESLVQNRIHRMYIVGSVETASPLMGLVTMSDVLRDIVGGCNNPAASE